MNDPATYARVWRRIAELGDPEVVREEALRRFGPIDWEDREQVRAFNKLAQEIHIEMARQEPKHDPTEKSDTLDVYYHDDTKETLVVRRDAIGALCIQAGDTLQCFIDQHLDVLGVRILDASPDQAAAVLDSMAVDHHCPDLARAAMRLRRTKFRPVQGFEAFGPVPLPRFSRN